MKDLNTEKIVPPVLVTNSNNEITRILVAELKAYDSTETVNKIKFCMQ